MAKRHAPSVSTLQTDDALDTLVTDAELEKRGFGDRSTRWRMVQAGRFPKPIQLSPGCKRWRWSAIVQWLQELEANPVQSRTYHRVWEHAREDKVAAGLDVETRVDR